MTLNLSIKILMNKIILFIFLFWSQGVASQCAHPDLEAMKSIYIAAGGIKWLDNTGWKEGVEGINCDPCSGWKGVSCAYGRVTRIILRLNGLTGIIAPEIGELAKLQWINLAANNLTGKIPERFFKLPNLHNINLEGNLLEGSINEDIKKLKNLQTLKLNANKLSGPLPEAIWEIRNIAELELLGNQFSGMISPKIGQAKKLLVLLLDGNLLTGIIPSEIRELTRMRTLGLSNNKLSGTIPDGLCNMEYLSFLYLNNNKITGSIPDCWSNSKFLKIISLGNNQLNGEIPETFGDLRSVSNILLNNNKLTGSLPSSLSKTKYLNFLDLSYNDLSGCFDFSLIGLCEPKDSLIISGSETKYFYANINLSNNPKLPAFNGFRDFCGTDRSLAIQQGRPCDDGFAATANDIIKDDCTCQGTIIDPCLVVKIDTFTTILYDTISNEFINNIYLNDTLYIKYHPSNTNHAQLVDLKVYPNPIFDQFYISIDIPSVHKPSLYKIYNSLGQSVVSGSLGESLTEVNVSAMNLNGLYLLKLYDVNLRTIGSVKLIFVKN